jgi:8-oxo-dGTP diphosphatase
MNPSLRNMTSLFFVEEEGLWCLFRQGSRVANNKYVGACGGHFEESELSSPEACVLREMKEELGLDPDEIEGLALRYVTLRGMDREIRQNYYFFAKLREERQLKSTEGQLHWIKFSDIPALKMPSSAKYMILHYLRQGRFDDTLYAGVSESWGANFAPLGEFDD